MLADAVRLFFHWPDGGVWSNIIASVIWTGPAWLVAFFSWRHRRCRGTWWCHRLGQFEVADTTYKVCPVHHKPAHHRRAWKIHQVKHPDRMSHGETL